MPLGLPSELAGPGFLSILLIAAFIVARRTRRPAPGAVLPAACAALALQALHVAEEFSTGFHVHAPAMLGLAPWSPAFFIWVNLAAIALWVMVLRRLALGKADFVSVGLLWFLAIASLGNAIWHPGVSLAIGAYFPGTVTAPLLGIAGYRLARRLSRSPLPTGEGAQA